jgi:SET domain-containing protein
MVRQPLWRAPCLHPSCKRVTRVYPYCWQHAESELHVRIRPSTWLPKGNYGLHAAVAMSNSTKRPVVFRKNEIILQYDGEYLTAQEISRRYDKLVIKNHKPYLEEGFAPYALEYDEGRYVDAAHKRGYAAYINDPDGPVLSKQPANAIFDGLNIVAIRDIYNNDEILVNYGKDYWKERRK